MMENDISCPFPARVVGELVSVEEFDSKGNTPGIFAICRRNKKKYLVEVTALEWEGKPPKGAEWIDAYITRPGQEWRERFGSLCCQNFFSC